MKEWTVKKEKEDLRYGSIRHECAKAGVDMMTTGWEGGRQRHWGGWLSKLVVSGNTNVMITDNADRPTFGMI